MECNFCKDNVKDFDKPRKAHLILHKDSNDHVHVHGDLDRKDHLRDMLEAAEEQVGLLAKTDKLPFKEVVFHNRQRIGDTIVFTCGIRDFKKAFPDVRVNVNSIAGHIWDHNPNIDRTLLPRFDDGLKIDTITVKDFLEGRTNVVKIGPGSLTNSSNRLDWHFTNAYRVSIEKELNIHIPQGESRGDIYLTEEEYSAPRIMPGPYWIICITGEKGWGCKMFPFVKWQEFVNQNPDKTFVQIGAKEDNPPRLQGPNVIDYVGMTQDKNTGIRDLYKMFLNAEGSIGLVSFHMHLSGALYKPAVVVAGAREPVHFTRYPGHQYLSDDGCLPCAVKACWHCEIGSCTNSVERKDQHGNNEIVPKCVDIIEAEDLTRAINMYYKGGRLVAGVASAKPDRKLFKNVVPTPPKVEAPVKVPEAVKAPVPVNTYGLSFNGGALREDDYNFLKKIIEKGNVKTVLEFGTGLSTLLLADLGVKVTTYETSVTWRDRMLKIKPGLDIRLWDGKNHPDFDGAQKYNYDLAFVDGPSGGHARERATAVAAACANLVVVHDGWDTFEAEWQEKYLDGKFAGPFRNAGRCYFWDKDGKIGPEVAEKEIVSLRLILQRKQGIVEGRVKDEKEKEGKKEANVLTAGVATVGGGPSQKFVKIVSTARGWGGCARSVTTIMRMLLAAGHKVEFIPFRNAVTGSEMRQVLKSELRDVMVTETYDTLKEHCDTLLVYADDYVWEFAKPEIVEAFSDIGADKKVMMLNYRRGKVGEIPWTQGWDKYMFLNSGQRVELDKVWDKGMRKVLPPCTDLKPFFEVKPDYNHSLRLVRHSSQGDVKFDKDNFISECKSVLERPDAHIAMLPGPSFIPQSERFDKVPRTPDPVHIAGFLGTGNLFWYSLPLGYMDMGPRVILEAMAAGLPVLADNWGGAIDRVTPETGWLCDTKRQHIETIKSLDATILKQKGEAARARAFAEFRPEKWIEELVG